MVERDAAGRATADTAAVLARIGGRSLAQHTSENFPVALRVVPKHPRDQLLRLYTYARFVDDLGDEAPGDRSRLLDAVEEDVNRLAAGSPTSPTLPPVAALAPVVAECGLPLQPLRDLIAANRRDQEVTRYASFGDLLDYCRLSAAPVGRMVLYVAGTPVVDGDDAARWSDSICAGLQVLEHCQDVGEDARAGRIYLPADDLAAAGVADADLLSHVTAPAVRAVVARQVDRARELLDTGRPLVRRLRGWPRLAIAGYLAGGLATAAGLRAADHDVLAGQVRPGKARTGLLAIRLAAAG